MFSVSGVTSRDTLSCGISQGSVLGPIEFIAYTADIICVFLSISVTFSIISTLMTNKLKHRFTF